MTTHDEHREDYLWNPEAPCEGEQAREIARLERALEPFRQRAGPPELPEFRELSTPESAPAPPRLGPSRWLPLTLAAAALVLFILRPWSGTPPAPATIARDQPGDVHEAGEEPLLVQVAELGTLELAPGSRLRVEQTLEERRVYFLERGKLHADIIAEPRVFQVGSPAGLTIDLGCEYDLAVLEDERVALTVTKGQVSFQHGGRRVYVPNGASTTSHTDSGPTPPLFDDAPDGLRTLVLAAHSGELQQKLSMIKGGDMLFDDLVPDRDAILPCLALLFDPAQPESMRLEIYRRVARLVELPESADEAAVLALEPNAYDAIVDAMRPWWRRQ